MKIAVILRQVPDVVQELVIAADGRSLAKDELTYITNEGDEHALEEGPILKSRHAATVTAGGVGGDEARDALATAVAKGADEALLVSIPLERRGDNHGLAAYLAPAITSGGYDLVLTGVWAADQLDAGLAGLLAVQLSFPYVGGLTAVAVEPAGNRATVHKEFPGGRLGVMEVSLPAVLGIQSAEQPLRYASVSKISQAKRTMQVKEFRGSLPNVEGVHVSRLTKPEASAKADMLQGDASRVAETLVRILRERGLV